MTQHYDCEHVGEIDGSCGPDRCWAADHNGPRCAVVAVCTCRDVCDAEQDTGCLYCRTADPELPCPNLDAGETP